MWLVLDQEPMQEQLQPGMIQGMMEKPCKQRHHNL